MTARASVMLVGLHGATASTLVAGTIAMQRRIAQPAAGTTELECFNGSSLISLDDLAFGGWDLRSGSTYDAASRHQIVAQDVLTAIHREISVIHALPGLRTNVDIPREPDHTNRGPKLSSVDDAVSCLADNIRQERVRHGAEHSIVIFLASPNRRLDDTVRASGWEQLRALPADDVSAGLIYAYAAVAAGAHFIDFTPCDTLESTPLLTAADERGVQIAGRDGSTGQTMLKVHLAHLFAMRGIRLAGWYSSNIIGNHDGYVLSLAGHDETKLSDKTGGVSPFVEDLGSFAHKVRIDYFPPHGDAKESWDAIDATAWLGAPISMRLNWRGHDSFLAAPMLLDLIRLVVAGTPLRCGLQPQLGFFFKRPFGREHSSLASRFSELIQAYANSEPPW